MTRDEMQQEIAAGMEEFRRARTVVEEAQRRLERVFSEANEDDQMWFAGRVMTALGALVEETSALKVGKGTSGFPFPPMVH